MHNEGRCIPKGGAVLDTEDQVVRIVKRIGCAELVLDRPERRNALTIPLVVQLRNALAEVTADSDVSVVMIRGEGGCLCSGLDLNELGGPANAERRSAFGPQWAALHAELASCVLPTVGVLEGAAVAGGAALALACDFLVAGQGSHLQVSEVTMGMTAPINLAWILAKYGAGRALGLVLGATSHSGEDLYRLGLATVVVEDGDVLAMARALAARLAGHDRQAMARTKAMITRFAPTGGVAVLIEELRAMA